MPLSIYEGRFDARMDQRAIREARTLQGSPRTVQGVEQKIARFKNRLEQARLQALERLSKLSSSGKESDAGSNEQENDEAAKNQI
jgi:hypothetical protein